MNFSKQKLFPLICRNPARLSNLCSEKIKTPRGLFHGICIFTIDSAKTNDFHTKQDSEGES